MSADPVAICRDLLRCPSVTPAEGGALSYLEKILKAAGFSVERVMFKEPGFDDIDNLYARIGTAAPHLMFAGHTDVVPPGDVSKWTHDPFSGDIANGMLYGRGAVGGQFLTCLPHLERLRRDLGDQVAVWPFDGLGDRGAPVVLAETWFGLFGWQSERHEVRDAKQVAGTLRHFRSIGPDGLLDLLDPQAIAALTGRRRAEVLGEEGWTLGVR